MYEILHDFPVAAARTKVFEAVATEQGLERWWTRSSEGRTEVGAEWRLYFDPEFDWRGSVTRLETDRLIEWEITRADTEWTGTRVSVELSDHPGGLTWVRFSHSAWRTAGEHFRISSYCWAMYLRLLKQWLQGGETVPYDRRLEV